MRVLVVEDNAKMAALIRRVLVAERIGVDVAADAEAGLALGRDGSYDVIVLDRMLPDLDGLAVLRELRAGHVQTPVLMLTALGSVEQRIGGLDAGADDYLVKPFDLDELFARVRALQRRARGAAVNEIELGGVRLDPASRSVTYGGEAVPLQRREYMLLERLLQSAGQVLSRAQLEESLYGWDSGAESNTLDVHIHHLRRKLYPGFIRTVRGVGYTIDAQPRPGG